MPTPKISTITTYDSTIKAGAFEYLLDVDWRLVKAQLFQESRLQLDAVSPVGAMGPAQFMPETWNEVKEKMRMPAHASPFDPNFAILALCFYMAELHSKWTSKREDADRYALALASYNAGTGNILKAQKLAEKGLGKPVNDYQRIIAHLPLITGSKNASETTTYVRNIFVYFAEQITGERIIR
jgi:membrane-bound lytic murein transglycosylase MltF